MSSSNQFLSSQDSRKLFVLGNGPSLRGFDFTALKPFQTIGMNAAYRYWDRVNWYPTYYACLDVVTIQSHQDNIYRLVKQHEQLGIRHFFLRWTILKAYPDLQYHPNVFIWDFEKLKHPFLSDRYFSRITTGSHSALFAMWMGYTQIFLLGIDLNYVEIINDARRVGKTELEIVSTPDNNPNYFFDDYQQAGDRYQIPSSSPRLHVNAWRDVHQITQKLDVAVYNCNPDSSVQYFPLLTIDQAKALPETPPVTIPSDDNRISALMAVQPSFMRRLLKRLKKIRRFYRGAIRWLGFAVVVVVLAAVALGGRLGQLLLAMAILMLLVVVVYASE